MARPIGSGVKPKYKRNPKTQRWQWAFRTTVGVNGNRRWVFLDESIGEHEVERAQVAAREEAEALRNAGALPASVVLSVHEYVEKRWLPSREGRLASVRDDRSRFRDHVDPIIGSLDVTKVARDDIKRVVASLDRKVQTGELSWITASNVWTVVTTLFGDAVGGKEREGCLPLEVRSDDPTANVRGPDRGSRKAKQYLYPSEFLKFVTCEKVPMRWRRAVAVAIYTFARDGEMRAWRWQDGDVDLEHGVLDITRAWNRRTRLIAQTKSGETRRFAIEAALLPLLQAMHDEKDGEGPVVPLTSERAMAKNLRHFLWKAGVRRPALHTATDTSKALTWHDMRATGITWASVRGDDPLKIKRRAGHKSFSTTEIYVREAEAIRDGFGDPFPPLPACLMGGPKVSARVSARAGTFSGSPRKQAGSDAVARVC